MAENAATGPASSTESAPADSQPSESSLQTPPSEESPQSPPPADTSSQSPPPSESSTPPPTDSSSTSPPPPTEQTPETPSSEGQSSPPPPSDTPPSTPTPNNKFSPPPPTSSKNHSPPPPRSLRSHSSSDKSSSGGSDHGSSTSSALIPAVVGAMVGMGMLLILGMLVYLCACRKKKRSPSYDNQAYSKPGSKGSKGQNFKMPPPASPMNWQQYNASPGNLATPPGQVATSPRGWPSASPQPVPPFSSSGEMSGGFSGSQGTPLPPPHHGGLSLGFSKAMFSYEELAEATNGFAQSNLIGQGGFGYVHQGVLPNGKEVAVKSLKKGSGQGDREFQAEVEIISRVHHRHLVSLVGYSIAGDQRLLAYEFIPNNTLEFHLHGKGNATMDWATRLKIAIGAAKGFAYLHEDCHPRIIHRDIKAANILLDCNFEAKVADFGLAKLTSDNNTHVSTRVMGTFGYLAPEYASSGKLTDKSDVFSFGVMLLELISGRRPVDNHRDMDESLVDWARPLCTKVLEDGRFDELADPFMEGNYNPQEMARMVACAGSAVKHSAKKRPKMSQIVRALEGDVSIDHLNEWVKGGELRGYTSSSSSGSYDMESSNYSADMRKFRKVAIDSREYQSSEFGNTSEYGLNPSSSSSENNSGSIRKLP